MTNRQPDLLVAAGEGDDAAVDEGRQDIEESVAGLAEEEDEDDDKPNPGQPPFRQLIPTPATTAGPTDSRSVQPPVVVKENNITIWWIL